MVLLVFSSLGLVFVIYALRCSAGARAAKSWPTVAGLVTESKHSHDPESQSKVEYSYSVAASRYNSTRIKFGDRLGYSLFSPNAQAKKYPLGMPVLVHYAPNQPSHAVLELGVAIGTASMGVVGLVFLAIGIASLWWRPLQLLIP